MDRVDCGKFFYTLPISWYISQEIIKRKKKGLLIDKLMLVALKDTQVATKVTGPGFCEERERQALEEATILTSIAISLSKHASKRMTPELLNLILVNGVKLIIYRRKPGRQVSSKNCMLITGNLRDCFNLLSRSKL
jgi:hypothetical protein